MNKRIYIRTDGNTKIGLGHLVRCSALAQMLTNDYEITFFCIDIPYSTKQELESKGIEVIEIESDAFFFQSISNKPIIILDGYHFDTNYQKKIKELGCILVCIDDLHNKEFYADLVINHAPGISSENYLAQKYTKFALGLEFALLRPAFLDGKTLRSKSEELETLFICFGGSDVLNLTIKSLKIAVSDKKLKTINVVTGAAYDYLEELSLIKDNRIVHLHDINEKQMAEIMHASQIAIIPASGILYESLACGCKIISGYYVDNQKDIYDGFKKLNTFIDVENFNSKLIQHALLNANHFNQPQLIDGLSRERFISLFNQLDKK